MKRTVVPVVAVLAALATSSAATAGPKFIVAGQALDYTDKAQYQEWIDPLADGEDVLQQAIQRLGGKRSDYDVTTKPRFTELNTSKSTRTEHYGISQAPQGYTVCDAWLLGEPFNTGQFRGVLTTADKSPDHYDGVHWYLQTPKKKRLHVDFAVVFVDASQKKPGNCLPTDDAKSPALSWNS